MRKCKGFIALFLSIALVFGSAVEAFASARDMERASNVSLGMREVLKIPDVSGEQDAQDVKKEFPLIEAFLNSKMDHSQIDEKEIYVLEFEDGKKEEVLQQLQTIEGIKLKYEYDTIFQGVSVEVKNSQISLIQAIEGIKNIQKNGTFTPQMISAKELTNVLEAVEYHNLLIGGDESKKLDGRSTLIAIIDSGIDINHPAMSIDDEAKEYVRIKENEIQEGFTLKVPHGFNYLGGNYDLMDRITGGHGMHIAGIIAGNSKELKGIAPNAQILMYRIFSDRSYFTKDKKGDIISDSAQFEHAGDDAVYHAMEDAVKRKADVISMSIGRQGGGYAGDIFYNAVKKATESGVIVVTAMGNYSSSASTNTFDNVALNEHNLKDASAMTYYAGVGRGLSVGSVTNFKAHLDKFAIGERKFGYSYLGFTKENKEAIEKFKKDYEQAKAQGVEFVYVGHARESAFKNKNVNGKIAVALRGGGRIDEKLKNAAQRGAKGFILINAPIGYSRDHYNEYPVLIYGVDRNMSEIVKKYGMWAIGISGNDGDFIKSLIEQNSSLEFEFLDANQNHLRTLSTSHFFKKLIASLPNESEFRSKMIKLPHPFFKWDGKLYDKKKGDYVEAPDGQYYYRVRARVKSDSPYQEMILPVRIDNTRPTASSLEINEENATFKVQDNHGIWFVGASIDNQPVALHRISENEYAVDKKDINALTTSELRVEAMDFAGNIMEPVVVQLNQSSRKSGNLAGTKESLNSHSSEIRGPKIYSDIDDELEAKMRVMLYDFMLNYLEPKSSDLEEISDGVYELDVEVSFDWRRGYGEDDEDEDEDDEEDEQEDEEDEEDEEDNERDSNQSDDGDDEREDSQDDSGDEREDEDESSSSLKKRAKEEKIRLKDYELKLTSINTSKNGYKPLSAHILEAYDRGLDI